jgi:thiamine pyrophosphokinase
VPDIVLGDYDSTGMRGRIDEMRQSGAYVEVYPAEKDFTDTEAAVKCALRKGAEEIVILGATGGRLDHFLANLDLCLVPLRRGVKCTLADEHNELRLLDRGITLCADEAAGRYISLLPFTDLVSGVTLTGMKYPLLDAPLVRGSSLGVSNEVTGETARIDFREGILILVLSRD